MNNTTVINLKTKKDLKNNAQKIAAELGLSLSAIINGYLRQFVRNRAAYFSVAPQMSNELENLLAGVEYDIQRKKNLSKPLASKKNIAKHLSSL